jgi:integrase
MDSQPLTADELRSIQDYLAMRDENLRWLFVSERGKQLARRSVNCIIGEAGKRAGLGHVHPSRLRYSCGHALANKGLDVGVIQDWLGDRHPTALILLRSSMLRWGVGLGPSHDTGRKRQEPRSDRRILACDF